MDEPLGRVSRALAIPETFCVEISAHGWEEEGRIVFELARAFPFLKDERDLDGMIDPLRNYLNPLPQYVIVIRDIPDSDAARENVGRVADLIGSDYPALFANQCVVLDGWTKGSIDVRWGDETRVVPVRALKTS